MIPVKQKFKCALKLKLAQLKFFFIRSTTRGRGTERKREHECDDLQKDVFTYIIKLKEKKILFSSSVYFLWRRMKMMPTKRFYLLFDNSILPLFQAEPTEGQKKTNNNNKRFTLSINFRFSLPFHRELVCLSSMKNRLKLLQRISFLLFAPFRSFSLFFAFVFLLPHEQYTPNVSPFTRFTVKI